MLSSQRPRPRRLGARGPKGLVACATQLLRTPVVAAVPVQRYHPAIVLTASLAEISALVGVVATGSPAAMVLLLGFSVLVTAVALTNRRQVVVLTGKGNVMMTASMRGRPEGVLGPVDRDLSLPEPAGLGVSIEIGGRIWWVDRSSFLFLRRARLVQLAEAERRE